MLLNTVLSPAEADTAEDQDLPNFPTVSSKDVMKLSLVEDNTVMHQSIPVVPIPPPGNRGAFAYFVSPGGCALAYPGATPGHLTHVFSKDG